MDKVDVTLSADRYRPGQGLQARINVLDPALATHDAVFYLIAKGNVHDSRPVNAEKTLFEQPISLRGGEVSVQIPASAVDAYTYKGSKIDIQLLTRVKVDDALVFDTKVDEAHEFAIGRKPEVAAEAKAVIEPSDLFDFFANLRAIPARNQMITLALALVGLVVVGINMFVGVHDQFSTPAFSYFYDQVDSDGDYESPLMKALMGSGAFGTAIWFMIRAQLRKYMQFHFLKKPPPIRRGQKYTVAELVAGQSRVMLKDVTLRVVACNMERGQYKRGSGTKTRTVSFSEPVRGVLLYEQRAMHIPARSPVTEYFSGSFSFDPMFSTLYPPCSVSASHGLGVHWEVQLLHPDYVDQELVGDSGSLQREDFMDA